MFGQIVDELQDLYPDEITIERLEGRAVDGTPTYGDSLVVSARVSGKIQRVMGTDGNEHVTTVIAWLAGVNNVSTQDRYTLPPRFSRNRLDPDNLQSRQFKAIAVEQVSDENGPHHEKVYF